MFGFLPNFFSSAASFASIALSSLVHSAPRRCRACAEPKAASPRRRGRGSARAGAQRSTPGGGVPVWRHCWEILFQERFTEGSEAGAGGSDPTPPILEGDRRATKKVQPGRSRRRRPGWSAILGWLARNSPIYSVGYLNSLPMASLASL
jgi:hypothetical protein